MRRAIGWRGLRTSAHFAVRIAVGLLLPFPSVVTAQLETQTPKYGPPVARFLQPSARLGETVALELTWRHPAADAVVLPDSVGTDFRPFELVRRRAFSTRTAAGQSLDRVVYWVRTFAPDSVQTLTLAGYLLTSRGDTVAVPGTEAVLRLQFVTPRPDRARPPALRPVLLPEVVTARFNWPWWAASAGVVALAGLAAWLIWGRRARARYRAYRRRKNHQYFLVQYARHIERFELSRSVANLERAITLWKNYLTTLENEPINSLTTKELLTIYEHDESVADALRLGDRAIYGNQLSDDIARETRALAALRTFADARYAGISD